MNLLETVSAYLTPDLISKVTGPSSMATESPTHIRKAVSASVPTVLAGLVAASSTKAGADRIFAALSQGDHANILDRLGEMSGEQTTQLAARGQGMLARLLGDKTSGIVDLIGGTAGVRTAAASSAIGLVTSIIAGVLGREISTRGLSPKGLADMLFSNRQAIADSPDSPQGLASALGVTELRDIGGPATATAVREFNPSPARARSEWEKLVLPIAIGVILIGGLWALTRDHAPRTRATAEPEVVERLHTTGARIALPSGKAVVVDDQSGEADLARALAAGSGDVGKRYTLGDLNFESTTTNLTPASTPNVDNLAEILKAYPTARVRLEGHTDNTGSPAANQELSAGRADKIRQMLIERGVAPGRVESTGMGEAEPVAANDTEQGRAQNRRIEIVILER